MLTDTRIRALRAREKRYRITDADGLMLEVRPNGKKTFVLRYQVNKRRRDKLLGHYPRMSLREARQLANAALLAIAAGEDPFIATRKRIKPAFDVIAGEMLAEKLVGKSPSYRKKLRILHNKYLMTLSGQVIDQVSPDQIRSLLLSITADGKTETAQRVQRLIGEVFRFAMLRGLCREDPSAILKGLIVRNRVKHYAHIDRPELLGRLLCDIDAAIAAGVFSFSVGFALQLLPHLFVRPSNLRLAMLDEFDFVENLWRIPAERMKMRRPHVVPLSRQALALVLEAKRLARCGFLLPGQRCRRPLSPQSINQAIKRLGYGPDVITPHGFRGTASSMLNELGYDARVIEKQLAHEPRSQMVAAYNHAQYIDKRRELMQIWSDLLDDCRQRRVRHSRRHDNMGVFERGAP